MPRATSLPVTVLLTALVALGPISTDLYLPSLPAMARAFGAPVGEVQLTLSVFLAGFATAQLAYGPLSDRFGRRPILLIGLGIYVAASLACALAPSIGVLIAARFLQAVGGCAGPVLCRAVVRDVHGREGAARVLAYLSSAVALAPALGPILGGFLEVWSGWRANLLVLVAYGASGLAAAALILPETNPSPDATAMHPRRMLANYAGLLGRRTYLGYALCCTFAYSGIFAFISGSSFVLVDRIGLRPDEYGFCFAAVACSYMAGALAAGRLTRRMGIDRMVRAGGAITGVGGAIPAAVGWSGAAPNGLGGAAAIIAPMMLCIAGIGLVLPNAMAGAIGPFPRIAGAASALLGFMQMTTAAMIGVAVGHLHDGTERPMTTAIAAAVLLIPATYFGLIRPAGRTAVMSGSGSAAGEPAPAAPPAACRYR